MDVVIQTSNVSLAHRIMLYYEAKHPAVFRMEGVGETALQLGSSKGNQGQALVLVCNVTIPPKDFVDWLQRSIFFRYIDRLYWLDPKEGPVTAPGDIVEAVVPKILPSDTIRVLCAPRSMEKIIADALPLDVQLDPRSNTLVLAVVQDNEGLLRFGLTPTSINYRQSMRKPRQLADSCCTAVHKLEEALHIAGFTEEHLGTAVDLGAAPGAWTQYLAKRARKVIAVDPADLDTSVQNSPNVQHIQHKAEDAIPQIMALTGTKGADLLVCDMNHHPFDALKILSCLLPVLRSGGSIVWTLKFFGKGKDREEKLKHLSMKLPEEIEGVEFHWLLANTQSERTMVARKSELKEQVSIKSVTSS